jgi:hypothetical protein
LATEPVSSAELRTAALAALIASARTEVSIYEHVIERQVFEDERVLAAIRHVAVSGRRAHVRLLVHDTSRLHGDAPQLLALAQRLTSAIAIRCPVEASDLAHGAAFTTVDAGGLLFRPEASRHEGRPAVGEPGEHARLQAYFDAVWERSTPAAELRRLDI